VAPDRILASTFTRKAAGEILDRVLRRLAEAALDADEAAELARHAALPGGAGGSGAARRPEGAAPGSGGAPPDGGGSALDREGALRLLGALVRELHRIDVGTLDSFFIRLARAFGPELGLPLAWSIAEEPLHEDLRSQAVQRVLDGGDRTALLELLGMIARGDARRRIHDALVEDVDDLRRLRREVDPRAADPWSPFREHERPGDPEAAREELAARLEAIEPPSNKNGSPNAHWSSALEAAAAALREGRWEELWGKGLGAKLLDGSLTYYRRPFPPGLEAILEEARALAAADLARAFDAEARALGEIARRYDEALSELQGRSGSYRFEDVPWLIGGPARGGREGAGAEGGSGPGAGAVGGRPDLHHRLDRRSEHLLLDEFQDTSLPQWTALEPIADGIAPDGTLVVVADPKQSIYGWRNADPELVDRVEARYGLPVRGLHVSWRSSPVVLDFVNRLFGELASNPVLADVEGGPEVASRWGATFEPHEPAPGHGSWPGRVVLEAGPDDGGRGTDRPRLMARAAERVAAIHERSPGARIGVLVSQNKTVARLMHELRQRGVRASEEGGTPVDDAAPVTAVLALLQLSDHPGDTVARYHVARSPLGPAVGFTAFGDDAAARALARRVRRRLLRDGYGPALAAWAEALAPSVEEAELRRLEQLVELGFRWEERASLRPSDFVRFVRSQKVEDPSSAPVRVMTVHQAKGLEFDVVVLPELDVGLTKGGGGETAVPERDPDTGRVRRVFPYVAGTLRPLFPELETAYRQRRATALRDRLSWLYVAVTRARHALHLIVAADGGGKTGNARSYARIARAALGVHEDPAAEGEVLYEAGDPDWYRELPHLLERPEAAPAAEVALRVDASAPRSRILARRAPSELEGGGRVDLAELLRLDAASARAVGIVAHRWCEEIGWIEGAPLEAVGEDRLLEAGREAAPELGREELGRLLERFLGWLDAPEIRDALSRERSLERARAALAEAGEPPAAEAGERPAGEAGEPLDLELLTERRFASRVDHEVVSGIIDRLVLVRPAAGTGAGSGGGGRGAGARGRPAPVGAAEVVDFKTDALPPDDEEAAAARVEHYRPQLEAYRDAVAALYGLPAEAVRARLVFLAAGLVRDV